MTGNSALMTRAFERDDARLGVRRPRTVQVRHAAGGAWEVVRPDGTGSTTCETLSAARRIARRWAEANRPSEMIIRDAYHRVVLRRSFTEMERGART